MHRQERYGKRSWKLKRQYYRESYGHRRARYVLQALKKGLERRMRHRMQYELVKEVQDLVP